VNECVLVAAPGGNPAPVVSLVWALHRQWSLRVASAHLLLYRNAEHYLHEELLGGARPLAQLRAHLGDPELAQLNLRPVQAADGTTLEDDAAPEHAARYVESLWSLVRQVQAAQPLPVIFGLVGGRRRTLAVDTAAVFQLLARPQDRLVDLRLDPKYADDPASGFFFPDQHGPCEVVDLQGRVYGAADVGVSLVEPRIPRLRRLLRQQDLVSFAHALEAGEAALEHGALPQVVLELRPRLLRVNDLTLRLSADQMIWYATLAVARQQGEGWVDVREPALLRELAQRCEAFWHRGEEGIGAPQLFTPEGAEDRIRRLRYIRSRLRRKLNEALRGHPHRGLLVPEQRHAEGRTVSVERLGIDGANVRVVDGVG
jgi:CRISPR-associated protein (TIGR02584 family)